MIVVLLLYHWHVKCGMGRPVQDSTGTDETGRRRTDPTDTKLHHRCSERWSAAIWAYRRRPVRRSAAILHSDEKPHRTGMYLYLYAIIYMYSYYRLQYTECVKVRA